MKKTLKYIFLLALLLLAAAQIIRPARTNPPVDPPDMMENILNIPPDVAATLDRACADCHSYRTRWPWYSNVAPMSWFVIDHVNQGRSHLNFSEWVRPMKEPVDTLDRLKAMCREVQSGGMPLSSYLWIHWNAKLSPDDVRKICDWTQQETLRLSTAK